MTDGESLAIGTSVAIDVKQYFPKFQFSPYKHDQPNMYWIDDNDSNDKDTDINGSNNIDHRHQPERSDQSQVPQVPQTASMFHRNAFLFKSKMKEAWIS